MRRPQAASDACTCSNPNLVNRSRCSTTMTVAAGRTEVSSACGDAVRPRPDLGHHLAHSQTLAGRPGHRRRPPDAPDRPSGRRWKHGSTPPPASLCGKCPSARRAWLPQLSPVRGTPGSLARLLRLTPALCAAVGTRRALLCFTHQRLLTRLDRDKDLDPLITTACDAGV